MEDLINALRNKIQEEITAYVSQQEKINHWKVKNIRRVQVWEIKGLPEKPATLFSGKEIKIRPEGNIQFMAKIKDGDSRSVSLEFWALDMKIRFDNEAEEFLITDIGTFNAFER